MNLIELIQKIKMIALNLKLVNSAYDGDVYTNWNSKQVNYGSVNIGIRTIETEGNLCTYTVMLYYGDRLMQDDRNTNEIFIDGVNVLQSIVNGLNNIDELDVSGSILYTPFQQEFADYLAGVYCELNITTNSVLGYCELEEFIESDKDKLINDIIEQINKWKTKDEELVNLLQEILHKIV